MEFPSNTPRVGAGAKVTGARPPYSGVWGHAEEKIWLRLTRLRTGYEEEDGGGGWGGGEMETRWKPGEYSDLSWSVNLSWPLP